jgi:hypothetical protein
MKKIIYSRFPGETAPDEATAINLVAKAMWEYWGRHLDPDAPFTREVDGEIECYCSEGAMERAVKHYRDDQWFAIIEDAPESAGQA